MNKRIQFSLTVREAESLDRAIEVMLKFGTEGQDLLCFGDKRNARRIQDRLAEAKGSPRTQRAESDASPEFADEPRYAILIRHSGWIDRYARRKAVSRFGKGEESIDSWVDDEELPSDEFAESELDAAAAHCRFLGERFGADGYRFHLIVRLMVPRWILANPERNREKGPVRSVEKIDR